MMRTCKVKPKSISSISSKSILGSLQISTSSTSPLLYFLLPLFYCSPSSCTVTAFCHFARSADKNHRRKWVPQTWLKCLTGEVGVSIGLLSWNTANKPMEQTQLIVCSIEQPTLTSTISTSNFVAFIPESNTGLVFGTMPPPQSL